MLQKYRTKIWEIFGIVVIIIISLIDMAAVLLDRTFNTGFRKPRITVQEVERLIEAQLPPGSNSVQVLAFIKAHYLHYRVDIWDAKPYTLNLKIDGKREFIKKCTIVRINKVGRMLTVTEDIAIKFYLDENDNLVGYVVDSWHTGL